MRKFKSQIYTMAFLFILAAGSAYAFDFQVTDNAPAGNCTTACTNPAPGDLCLLENALAVASCNDEGDSVNIAAGSYDASFATGVNTYNYDADANENFPLTLIGVSGGGTMIDAGNDTGVMLITTTGATTDANADIIVRQIVFQNGANSSGLWIDTDEGDITVENCQFLDNHGSINGGGLQSRSGSGNIFLSSNLFLNNSTDDGNGGGFAADTSEGFITIVNNVLAENEVLGGGTAFGGGGFINNDNASVAITNNTLFNNSVEGNGGGLSINLDSSPNTIDIYNNIVWQNSATENGADIYTCELGATVNLFNNDFIDFFSESVDGTGCGSPTTINQGGNKNVDPLFVDSAMNDFHLTALSPVIDFGDPAAPSMPATDFDGNPRPAVPGTNPDMGAFEFQPVPPPTPTPTPTPPSSLFVEGSGVSCAFQPGLKMSTIKGLLAIFSIGVALGALIIKRQRNKGEEYVECSTCK